MCEMIASLITELKTLEVEEQSIQESRKRVTNQLKCLDQQLDDLIGKRSRILSELEFACNSEQSDNEFHSLTSDVDITGIFSDNESIPQKRKIRSTGSNNSDLDSKKIRSDHNEELELCPKTIDEVNNFDQQMIDKYIDDMADQLAKEYRNPDDHLKEALVVLASEPDFESLVNDVENDSLSNSSRTITMDAMEEFSPISFANVTIRSQCRNRKSKENITPPTDCGRNQTFQFSPNVKQRNALSAKKDHNCNYFAADRSSPPFATSDVLKGRKLLTNLLSNNTLDEKNKAKKSFSPSVDTKSKSFRDQMRLWQERENSGNIEFKPKRSKSALKMSDVIDSI